MSTAEALEMVEAREFSFISAAYMDDDDMMAAGFRVRFERFVVLDPYKSRARHVALEYATGKWGEPSRVEIYPRNYIRDARAAVKAGRWVPAPASEVK